VIAAIDELSYVEMDIELIRNTGIGRVIRKLTKDKRSPTVASQAKLLENKLKSLLDLPPPPTEKRSRTSSTSEPQTKKRNVSQEKPTIKNTPSTPEKSTPQKPTPPSTPSQNSGNSDFKGETNNPARNLVQGKLSQALGQCNVIGGTDTSSLSVFIENAMYKRWGDAKSKEYQSKFRSLFSNLKDPLNEGLRSALFTGDLTVETLIGMSPEELANPSLQQERKKLKEYQQEARRGDRHMRDATCSMFTCNKCQQNKTTYFQMQTRSADEPMTTFVTCCNCGHHWKF